MPESHPQSIIFFSSEFWKNFLEQQRLVFCSPSHVPIQLAPFDVNLKGINDPIQFKALERASIEFLTDLLKTVMEMTPKQITCTKYIVRLATKIPNSNLHTFKSFTRSN